MLNIILWILIIFSGLGILIIIIRTIPRLVMLPLEDYTPPLAYLKKVSLRGRLEKFLRKIKILILKTENQISNWQEKLRKKKPE